MNLRRSTHYTAEVYTGSLNDIMFFLMLFFLIISTLVNPSVIKLMLPNASKTQTISKQQVSLSISKDKEFFINNESVAFDQLETKLSEMTKSISDATIILRVDNSLTVQDLVDVLQIGNKIKVKMVLATKSSAK